MQIKVVVGDFREYANIRWKAIMSVTCIANQNNNYVCRCSDDVMHERICALRWASSNQANQAYIENIA